MLGHAWGMDQRTTAGAWGLYRTVQSRYLRGEMLSTQPLSIDSFFLTRKRSRELRLGITVETTENREDGAKLCKPPLRSVRAGSVSQRSSTGIGGHQRSPVVQRNRRSLALRLRQLG
jgi:hypothetical protein